MLCVQRGHEACARIDSDGERELTCDFSVKTQAKKRLARNIDTDYFIKTV